MPRSRPLAKFATAAALAFASAEIEPRDRAAYRAVAAARNGGSPVPPEVLARIQTVSPRMLDLLARLVRVAPANRPLVLVGATGTGKSLLARLVHDLSGRTGRFVARSAQHLDGEIIESLLFGHVRYAFTDAREDRPGYLTLAEGGTFVLNDLQNLPLHTQRRFLDVLQDHEYWPIGAKCPLPLLCRVIITVDQDLDTLREKGLLHEHLRWRLGDTALWVLSLAERREDIPLLARGFLAQCATIGIPGPTVISEEALAVLLTAPWPGNVRELEGVIEAAYQAAGAEDQAIAVAHLPERLRQPVAYRRGGDPRENLRAILAALARCGGRVNLGAKALGVSRSSVYYALRRAHAARRGAVSDVSEPRAG